MKNSDRLEELLLTAKLRTFGGTVCGEKFSRCFLTLDCLLEQLGIPAKQRVGKLLKALPLPPESWPYVPPENIYLAERYHLIRALLYRLEETE